jgi:hypothetical protein
LFVQINSSADRFFLQIGFFASSWELRGSNYLINLLLFFLRSSNCFFLMLSIWAWEIKFGRHLTIRILKLLARVPLLISNNKQNNNNNNNKFILCEPARLSRQRASSSDMRTLRKIILINAQAQLRAVIYLLTANITACRNELVAKVMQTN